MSIKVRLMKDGPFPVNNKLAGLVPMATGVEQSVLTEDIKVNEQREPIVIWHGEIVDGRCRQQALVLLGKHIVYKELDDDLTEDEVRIFVKSVNTRRNLTLTQKVITACKETLRPANTQTKQEVANAWGIGKVTLENARYIAKVRPDLIEPLFNGLTVAITNKEGRETQTNRVTSIYAYIKRLEEDVIVNQDRGWSTDSYITTQLGKDFYYSVIASGVITPEIQMILADEANRRYELKSGATTTDFNDNSI